MKETPQIYYCSRASRGSVTIVVGFRVAKVCYTQRGSRCRYRTAKAAASELKSIVAIAQMCRRRESYSYMIPLMLGNASGVCYLLQKQKTDHHVAVESRSSSPGLKNRAVAARTAPPSGRRLKENAIRCPMLLLVTGDEGQGGWRVG